mgnify:CR=1 FL=1
MAGFNKLARRMSQGEMSKNELKSALKKQSLKFDERGKVFSTVSAATELDTNAILAATTKHLPQLGPLPVAPDTAVLGIAAVVATLGKGKKARFAASVAKGAAHELISRMIHTDVIIPLSRPSGQSETVSGNDAVSRMVGRAASAVEGAVASTVVNAAGLAGDGDDDDDDDDVEEAA